jgi:hypothetical protein
MNVLLFLRRWWPYIALILALAALFIARQYDEAKYQRLSTDYANYRTRVAEANSAAEKAAREAVEAQIRERAKIDKANAEVMDAYQTKLAALAADRDHATELARRLLAARQANPGSRDRVPEAGDRPAAPEATPDAGDGLADRLARVAAECRGNAQQLSALLSQLKPQLEQP